MNPFVVAEAVAEAVVMEEAVVVVEEVVVVVVEVVVEDVEEVMEEAVMEVVVTVMEVADTVVDIMEEDMEEVMAVAAGAIGAAGGPSMDCLIAEANPVPIIFSKSLKRSSFLSIGWPPLINQADKVRSLSLWHVV